MAMNNDDFSKTEVCKEYFNFFNRLIMHQQKASETQFRETIGKKIDELLKMGRCLFGLHIIRRTKAYEYQTYSEDDARVTKFHVTFSIGDKRKLPENSFVVGSNAFVLCDPSKNNTFTESKAIMRGLIVNINDDSVVLEIETSSYQINNSHDSYAIILGSDQVTYSRQSHILNKFCNVENDKYMGDSKIKDVIIDAFKGRTHNLNVTEIENIKTFSKLDESKESAIRKIMGESPLFLLHGPPGTGKTLACAEVVAQYIKNNPESKILVCCDSNEAVDNILLKVSDILKYPSDNIILRIGHPFKVQERTKKYTISYKINNHPLMRILLKRLLYDESKTQKKEYEKKRDEYRKAVTKHGNISGFAQDKWNEYKSSQKQYNKINEQIKEIKKLVNEEVYSNARIFFCTNTVAATSQVRRIIYDIAVIDEAAQSTEPSCLIPMTIAKKVLLAGDHMQLPATVLLSEEKKDQLELEYLRVSLFERLFKLKCNFSQTLDIQYRMNDTLLYFSNKKFYGNLKSAEEVKNRNLPLYFSEDIVFINCNETEKFSREDGKRSIYNQGEVEIVKKLVNAYRNLSLTDKNMLLITPYSIQKKQLTIALRSHGITAKTIDGAQGQEADIVILSFVRSNPKGNIGFLTDEKRFNVAITRAKQKLIIVGNYKTITQDPLYKEWLKYVRSNGLYIESTELDKYILKDDKSGLIQVVEKLRTRKESEFYNLETIHELIDDKKEWYESLNYNKYSAELQYLFDKGWNLNKELQDKRLKDIIISLNPESVKKVLTAMHWIALKKYYLRNLEFTPKFIKYIEQDIATIENIALRNKTISEQDLINIKSQVTKAKGYIEGIIKTNIFLKSKTEEKDKIDESRILKDLFL